MPMITTCPACHTRFRVTKEQMDAHRGDVRCGRCAKVFNARNYLEQERDDLHEGQAKLPFDESGTSSETVVAQPVAPIKPSAPPPPAPAPAPTVETTIVQPEVLPEFKPEPEALAAPVPESLPEPEIVPQPQIQLEPQPEPQIEPQPEVIADLSALSFDEVRIEPESVSPQVTEDSPLVEASATVETFVPEWSESTAQEPVVPEEPAVEVMVVPPPPEPVVPVPVEIESLLIPEAMTQTEVIQEQPEEEIASEPKKRNFFWLWLIGVLFLLVTALAQGVYYLRTDLAALHPEIKPLLVRFCDALDCTIRLPANLELLNIETSNLEADPQQANRVTLNAILRNRASLAQEYPQLELVITNTSDQMIARRTFSPKEYAKRVDHSRGMAPNEEVTVKLPLDIGDLTATGYRVFLYYPQ